MAWAEEISFSTDGFSLHVPKWDFPDTGISCVWGSSGSGKTTLLQIMAGILPCPRFKLSVGGQLISDLPPQQRNVGFVFQDYALFPHMTVWENISFPARARKLSPVIWEEHARSLMRKLGIERLIDQKAATLSGGESQRTALARALVTKPRLVLMDEPLSALDEKTRDDARALIMELSRAYQVPFILVTHDLRDVRALSENMLVLSNGRVVAFGKTEEILNIPPSLEAAILIPENQILKVKRAGKTISFSGVGLEPGHRRPASTTQLVAKNWAFEAVSGDGSPEGLRAELTGFVDEGSIRSCLFRTSDGQNLKAWSRLFLTAKNLGQQMDLKIDRNGLILFEEP